MMNWVSSWAANIVIAVIASTILEMILPDSNNKKYVKTIIGVFILFNIIGPVITKVTGTEISFESIAQNFNMENISSREVMNLDTNSNVKEVYIENLKIDLANKVNEKGYEATQININVEMDNEENYGRISKISFKMQRKNEGNNEIQVVNEINVRINSSESTNQEIKQDNISIKEYKEMQEYIANSYGLEAENVNIY